MCVFFMEVSCSEAKALNRVVKWDQTSLFQCENWGLSLIYIREILLKHFANFMMHFNRQI